MGNVYKARWKAAKKLHESINEKIRAGFIVLDEDGVSVDREFKISEEQIIMPWKSGSGGGAVYFINDSELDNGMHTTIADYRDSFKDWRYVNPNHIEKLV